MTDSEWCTSRATAAQYQARANTLMHEMAHMWFGNLVTMQWWDDLWLKESFADYMGTLGVDRATDWDTAWVNFANKRKAWAYVTDKLPTTHPIVADTPDPEAFAAHLLANIPGATTCSPIPGGVRLGVQGARGVLPAVVAIADESDLILSDLRIDEPSLETVFINLTGKDLRE